MATEYTWTFPNFETDADDKVKTIHWSLNAVETTDNSFDVSTLS